jgi:hypothetical protein
LNGAPSPPHAVRRSAAVRTCGRAVTDRCIRQDPAGNRVSASRESAWARRGERVDLAAGAASTQRGSANAMT